ncbi:MAG: ABC transporter permease subunit [Proteobacteria bacterium]|nr:ABC transporter permease subunit [Pseudomonadota bacterium]
MNNFLAIYKRELRLYFTSPIAYVLVFIFLVLAGYFFYSGLTFYSMISLQSMRNPYMARLNLVDMIITPLFSNLSVVLLLMLPMLTMRLFAEEKKSGTYELLFSYPVRDVEVLLGKYFAAMTVFAVMLALTGFYHLLLAGLGLQVPRVVLSGYLGLLLLGGAFIALGIFISSLTENQIVAAVASFGVLLLFWIIGWSAASVGPGPAAFFEYISLVKHLMSFTKGLIDTADLAYYLLFTFFFLFLTLRSLESNRWRG